MIIRLWKTQELYLWSVVMPPGGGGMREAGAGAAAAQPTHHNARHSLAKPPTLKFS